MTLCHNYGNSPQWDPCLCWILMCCRLWQTRQQKARGSNSCYYWNIHTIICVIDISVSWAGMMRIPRSIRRTWDKINGKQCVPGEIPRIHPFIIEPWNQDNKSQMNRNHQILRQITESSAGAPKKTSFSAPQGRKLGPFWILESHPGMEGGRVISPRGKSYPEGAHCGKNPLCLADSNGRKSRLISLMVEQNEKEQKSMRGKFVWQFCPNPFLMNLLLRLRRLRVNFLQYSFCIAI